MLGKQLTFFFNFLGEDPQTPQTLQPYWLAFPIFPASRRGHHAGEVCHLSFRPGLYCPFEPCFGSKIPFVIGIFGKAPFPCKKYRFLPCFEASWPFCWTTYISFMCIYHVIFVRSFINNHFFFLWNLCFNLGHGTAFKCCILSHSWQKILYENDFGGPSSSWDTFSISLQIYIDLRDDQKIAKIRGI